jgi:hypothetical protein
LFNALAHLIRFCLDRRLGFVHGVARGCELLWFLQRLTRLDQLFPGQLLSALGSVVQFRRFRPKEICLLGGGPEVVRWILKFSARLLFGSRSRCRRLFRRSGAKLPGRCG